MAKRKVQPTATLAPPPPAFGLTLPKNLSFAPVPEQERRRGAPVDTSSAGNGGAGRKMSRKAVKRARALVGSTARSLQRLREGSSAVE